MHSADLTPSQSWIWHGIPANIVSEQGPEFICHICRAFCQVLRATLILFCGYNPQTNGQTELSCIRESILEFSPSSLDCVCSQLPVQHRHMYETILMFIVFPTTSISSPRGQGTHPLSPSPSPLLLKSLAPHSSHPSPFCWPPKMAHSLPSSPVS